MATETAHEEIEKRIRAVNKKLKQIKDLKEKSVDQLDDAAREKIASEPTLQKELAALEAQKSGRAAPAAPAPAAAAVDAPEPEVKVEEEAPAPAPALSDEEKEKRIKAIKKKISQIEKLKEKDLASLDAEAQAKVASEGELLAELARLEGKVPALEATVSAVNGSSSVDSKDPHADERAKALEPAAGDVGVLVDDETEKRFKALQKKLRDIAKLREKDTATLDKLQKEKLVAEAGLIKEIEEIKAKVQSKLASKRYAH